MKSYQGGMSSMVDKCIVQGVECLLEQFTVLI